MFRGPEPPPPLVGDIDFTKVPLRFLPGTNLVNALFDAIVADQQWKVELALKAMKDAGQADPSITPNFVRQRRTSSRMVAETALSLAIVQGRPGIVWCLLSNPDVDPELQPEGFTAFHCACLQGNLDIVDIFLRSKRPINLNPRASVGSNMPVFADVARQVPCNLPLLKKLAECDRIDVFARDSLGRSAYMVGTSGARCFLSSILDASTVSRLAYPEQPPSQASAKPPLAPVSTDRTVQPPREEATRQPLGPIVEESRKRPNRWASGSENSGQAQAQAQSTPPPPPGFLPVSRKRTRDEMEQEQQQDQATNGFGHVSFHIGNGHQQAHRNQLATTPSEVGTPILERPPLPPHPRPPPPPPPPVQQEVSIQDINDLIRGMP